MPNFVITVFPRYFQCDNDNNKNATDQKWNEITGLSWQNVHGNKYLGVGMCVTLKVGNFQLWTKTCSNKNFTSWLDAYDRLVNFNLKRSSLVMTLAFLQWPSSFTFKGLTHHHKKWQRGKSLWLMPNLGNLYTRGRCATACANVNQLSENLFLKHMTFIFSFSNS